MSHELPKNTDNQFKPKNQSQANINFETIDSEYVEVVDEVVKLNEEYEKISTELENAVEAFESQSPIYHRLVEWRNAENENWNNYCEIKQNNEESEDASIALGQYQYTRSKMWDLESNIYSWLDVEFPEQKSNIETLKKRRKDFYDKFLNVAYEK